MSVPTYDQFIEPILRYLAATPEGATARDAHEAAADALNLSEAQRQELIASGQATYKNRAGWAHDTPEATQAVEQCALHALLAEVLQQQGGDLADHAAVHTQGAEGLIQLLGVVDVAQRRGGFGAEGRAGRFAEQAAEAIQLLQAVAVPTQTRLSPRHFMPGSV